MDNEETILDLLYHTEKKGNKSETMAETKPKTKKAGRAGVAAGIAGGAVFGAGATFAGQAAASTVSDANVEEEVQTTTEQIESEQPATGDAPAPEESIVATATGVRVAQVDDDANFAQAFADARAQVGPGGVFEWHGRVYNTYYKDEWDSMSASERQEYQASIDYRDVTGEDAHHHTAHHDTNIRHTSNEDVTPTPSSTDDEVHVLAVTEVDMDGDGVADNVAVLEVNGTSIMLVDIDHDDMADIAICDVDGDGN